MAQAAADSLKADGNTLFAKQKFAAAIEKYTEAITMAPHMVVRSYAVINVQVTIYVNYDYCVTLSPAAWDL